MKWLFSILLLAATACATDSDTIKIKGSDTEVNLAVSLAEHFYDENAEIVISISGGGSGLGIASLLNGNADIANSSRSIKPSELAMFVDRNIVIDSFIFAQDALAMVVSDKLPLDSINPTDVAKILSGEYVNWSALIPDYNLPITIYGRQSNSGTYVYVEDILGIKYARSAMQMNGNAQIIEALKVDPSGFGYVGAGYVLDGNASRLKILNVYHEKSIAVSPLDEKAIASGDYFFQRPLFQYYKKEDFNRVKAFLDFEKSEKGARIIKESGYYPVKK